MPDSFRETFCIPASLLYQRQHAWRINPSAALQVYCRRNLGNEMIRLIYAAQRHEQLGNKP
ncbi:MAG: hypothetical protein O2977_07285 [Cyanobacteria bacterium]|nr:hypothetical protein [Cyanobacteriota bacterium]MDA1205681.1 hypothetical protein [Cyanobacteriota bacterium]